MQIYSIQLILPRNLKPGGWIELQYIDYHPTSDSVPASKLTSATMRYWELVNEGLSAIGVDHTLSFAGRLSTLMRDVGFVDITERNWKIPIGRWPKDAVLKQVGLYMRMILIDGISDISDVPLMQGLGWSEVEVRELQKSVVADMEHQSSKHCLYMPFRTVYARKPALDYALDGNGGQNLN